MAARPTWALWVLGLGGCAGARLGDPGRFDEGECRARYVLLREASPSFERDELGRVGPIVQRRFPAAEIGPQLQRPVSATAELRLGERPIAWFSRGLDMVVLDGAAFAPLRGVDVVALGADERGEVGRVTPRAREALGERAVVELLLRAEVIHTYENVGADLCLGAEATAEGEYRAELHGVQRVANERGRESERAIAFEVRIDAEDRITVTGRSVSP